MGSADTKISSCVHTSPMHTVSNADYLRALSDRAVEFDEFILRPLREIVRLHAVARYGVLIEFRCDRTALRHPPIERYLSSEFSHPSRVNSLNMRFTRRLAADVALVKRGVEDFRNVIYTLQEDDDGKITVAIDYQEYFNPFLSVEERGKRTFPKFVWQAESYFRGEFYKWLERSLGVARTDIAAVGESSLSELKTRPDYAVTVRNALAGFIEVKAPGKGADPRRFRDKHDKEQWQKLQSLPNLIYTDGNQISLWQNGEIQGSIVCLIGDIETSGADLDAPPALMNLFESFIQSEPIPPRDAKQLAETSGRLCRLLREEVTEQMLLGSPALTALATDWRRLLLPEASGEHFVPSSESRGFYGSAG